MAQITLNTKLTSESFTMDDLDMIYVNTLYVDGAAAGSTITIVDRANATTSTIDVEESPSAIALLTNKMVQVTLTSRATPYINIDRIKDIITNGSVANISYDNNGNVYTTLKTSMTTAQILSAIATEENELKVYMAIINQSGTSAPTATVLKNTLSGTPTWGYSSTGNYTLTLTGEFPEGDVTAFIQLYDSVASATTKMAVAGREDDNTIGVVTWRITEADSGGNPIKTATNSLLINASIVIYVKP